MFRYAPKALCGHPLIAFAAVKQNPFAMEFVDFKLCVRRVRMTIAGILDTDHLVAKISCRRSDKNFVKQCLQVKKYVTGEF